MMFKKEFWETQKLGDILKLEYGKNLTEEMRNGGPVPVYGSAGIVGWHDVALTSDKVLIVGRKGSVGNVFYSPEVCFPIDTTYYVEQENSREDLKWIEIFLSFYDLRRLNMATAVPGLNRNIVHEIKIPLPPLEEQKRIVALFQSIDKAIEQTVEQESSFRKLVKRLIDNYIDNYEFGKLLLNTQLKEVRWRDCVDKIMRKIDPVEEGIERIVAGGNLESEDFKIRTWGTVGVDFLGPAFHVLFEPGDILYGSRRTYLRKVAFPDFKGVCANTTFVVKAKKHLLLQDFLKHIMLSEKFTQYSIAKSKGSTNPYINWKDLDDFSFKLTDIETQQAMVEILDKCIFVAEEARNQKETLKKLKYKLLDEILG